ncbi:adenylyltransferase/cytidyltransferase family protein [Aquipuribacter nitratireducens]|uniref:Adenylyltransferase/cytidyltransferase family protein n=1 Tax=Aquipuribacter nitratireducens TaxID=650104 RepID=A0ABW0GPJ9_9MICO
MSARIGYTTGVFDMFHVGHLNVLRGARSRCDHLIVGVTTDELAEQRKGRAPVVPLLERMEIVQNVRYVDDVVTQTTMDKRLAWENLKFDVMFVGDDWRGTPAWDAIEAEFGALGVGVEYLPYTRHTSSSALRRSVFAE